MTSQVKAANSIQTAWHPYLLQRIRPAGLEDGGMGSRVQKLTPYATLAAVCVSIVAVAMLITIYMSMPSATPSVSSLYGSTAPSTANDTCKCQGHSDESLFFAYGEEANDYTMTSETVTYPVSAYIEYTLLGANEGQKPLEVSVPKRGGLLVRIKGPTKMMYLDLNTAHQYVPDLNSGTSAFHRKASTADKALFDCLIPDLKTKEAYVFTWANATLDSGFLLGTFQAVVAFAEDSTTYVIKNYGTNIAIPDGNDEAGYYPVSDPRLGYEYDSSLTTNDLRGKRDIIAVSEPIFGTNAVRVKEQKYGPC